MRAIAVSSAVLLLVTQSGCMTFGSLIADGLDHEESRRSAMSRGAALDSVVPAGLTLISIVELMHPDGGHSLIKAPWDILGAIALEAMVLLADFALWKLSDRDDEYDKRQR